MELYEDIICCPTCKGDLERKEESLFCPSCDHHFRLDGGIWDLIPPASAGIKLSERDHYSQKTDYYLWMHESWCGSPFYRHYHDSFLKKLFRLPAGSLILEAGCGLGHDGLQLLRSGYRVMETDIAPGQLRQARDLHERSGYAATSSHILADAESLPFASQCFDGAFMVASLHHLPDPSRCLREMRRVLRPEGMFVLGTEPNSWQNHTIYPLGKLVLRTVDRLTGASSDAADMVSEADKLLEGFSGRELGKLLREAGFNECELEPAGFLSAAVFFLSTELSRLYKRNIRLFPLENAAIPLDEILARIPMLRNYPWHWNAVAS